MKEVRLPPIASIREYEPISIRQLRDLKLPGEIMVMISHPELLYTVQADGTMNVLTSEVYDNGARVIGTIIDIVGRELQGSTTFSGIVGGEGARQVSILTTETYAMQRTGLATRRLITINEFCTERFGVHLSSSSTPSVSAKGVWKKLQNIGLVEFDPKLGAYTFK